MTLDDSAAVRLRERFCTLLLVPLALGLWLTGAAHAQSGIEPDSPPLELSFRDFFESPIGPGGARISRRLAAADGQRVRLVGYMVQQEAPKPGRILLTPRPVQMSEHADGDANDLPTATVLVRLDRTQSDWVVPHVRGQLAVTGVLQVGRYEEPDGQVYWVNLLLEPQSVRSMTLAEMAQHLHQRQHQH